MTRIIPLLLTCLVFPQFAIAFDAPPGPSTRPDLSTPLSAVVAFLQASSAGDETTARQVAVLDNATGRLLDFTFSADRAHKDFVGAAVTRFGDPAKAYLKPMSMRFLSRWPAVERS